MSGKSARETSLSRVAERLVRCRFSNTGSISRVRVSISRLTRSGRRVSSEKSSRRTPLIVKARIPLPERGFKLTMSVPFIHSSSGFSSPASGDRSVTDVSPMSSHDSSVIPASGDRSSRSFPARPSLARWVSSIPVRSVICWLYRHSSPRFGSAFRSSSEEILPRCR